MFLAYKAESVKKCALCSFLLHLVKSLVKLRWIHPDRGAARSDRRKYRVPRAP